MTPEHLNAAAAIIGAIAWPLIVLFVLLTYRKPLAKLLDNLESFTLPGGFQAKLQKAVEREAQTVIQANPDATKQVTADQVVAAERVGRLAAQSDLMVAREQMIELAKQYERVRGAMPPGEERTTQMEIVVTKMRTLAIACRPFVTDFVQSGDPGVRLAAIAILQVTPDARYLGWLSQRFKEETPFVAYQTGVALLTAARVSDQVNRAAVEQAILTAKDALGKDAQSTDRSRLLEQALSELRAAAT
jgi:hypothetical protein